MKKISLLFVTLFAFYVNAISQTTLQITSTPNTVNPCGEVLVDIKIVGANFGTHYKINRLPNFNRVENVTNATIGYESTFLEFTLLSSGDATFTYVTNATCENIISSTGDIPVIDTYTLSDNTGTTTISSNTYSYLVKATNPESLGYNAINISSIGTAVNRTITFKNNVGSSTSSTPLYLHIIEEVDPSISISISGSSPITVTFGTVSYVSGPTFLSATSSKKIYETIIDVRGFYEFSFIPTYKFDSCPSSNNTSSKITAYISCSQSSYSGCSMIKGANAQISSIKLTQTPAAISITKSETSPACYLGKSIDKEFVLTNDVAAGVATNVEVSITKSINSSYIELGSVEFFKIDAGGNETPIIDGGGGVDVVKINSWTAQYTDGLSASIKTIPSGYLRTETDYTTNNTTKGTFARVAKLLPGESIKVKYTLVMDCLAGVANAGTTKTRFWNEFNNEIESGDKIMYYEDRNNGVDVRYTDKECNGIIVKENLYTKETGIRIDTYSNCLKSDASLGEIFPASMYLMNWSDVHISIFNPIDNILSSSDKRNIRIKVKLDKGLRMHNNIYDSDGTFLYREYETVKLSRMYGGQEYTWTGTITDSDLVEDSTSFSSEDDIRIYTINFDKASFPTLPTSLPTGSKDILFFLNTGTTIDFKLRTYCTAKEVNSRYTVTTYLLDGDCSSCSEMPITSGQCGIDIHCPGCLIPGTVINSFDITRTTVGLRDNDKNGLPDIDPVTRNTMDADTYIKNRISNGDEVEFKAEIGTTTNDITFANLQTIDSAPIVLDKAYLTTIIPAGEYFTVKKLEIKIVDGSNTYTSTFDAASGYDFVTQGSASYDASSYYPVLLKEENSTGGLTGFAGATPTVNPKQLHISYDMNLEKLRQYLIYPTTLPAGMTIQTGSTIPTRYSENSHITVTTTLVCDKAINVAAYYETKLVNKAFFTGIDGGHNNTDRFDGGADALTIAASGSNAFTKEMQYYCENYGGTINMVFFEKRYYAHVRTKKELNKCSRYAVLSQFITFPGNLPTYYPSEFREFFPMNSCSLALSSNYQFLGGYITRDARDFAATNTCTTTVNIPITSSDITFQYSNDCFVGDDKITRSDENSYTEINFEYNPVCNDPTVSYEEDIFAYTIEEIQPNGSISSQTINNNQKKDHFNPNISVDADTYGYSSTYAAKEKSIEFDSPFKIKNNSNIVTSDDNTNANYHLNAPNVFLFFPNDKNFKVTDLRKADGSLAAKTVNSVDGSILFNIGSLHCIGYDGGNINSLEFKIIGEYDCTCTGCAPVDEDIDMYYGWACDVSKHPKSRTELNAILNSVTPTCVVMKKAKHRITAFTADMEISSINISNSLTAGCDNETLDVVIKPNSFGRVYNVKLNLSTTETALTFGNPSGVYKINSGGSPTTITCTLCTSGLGSIDFSNEFANGISSTEYPDGILIKIPVTLTCTNSLQATIKSTLEYEKYCGAIVPKVSEKVIDILPFPLSPEDDLSASVTATSVTNTNLLQIGTGQITITNSGTLPSKNGNVVSIPLSSFPSNITINASTDWVLNADGTALEHILGPINEAGTFPDFVDIPFTYTSSENNPGDYTFNVNILQATQVAACNCTQLTPLSGGQGTISVTNGCTENIFLNVEWCEGQYPVFSVFSGPGTLVPGTYTWVINGVTVNSSDANGPAFIWDWDALPYIPGVGGYEPTIRVFGTTNEGCSVDIVRNYIKEGITIYNCCQEDFAFTFNQITSTISSLLKPGSNEFIDGDILVQTNIVLINNDYIIPSNTNLYFMPGTRLIIRDNAKLTIRGAKLTSVCSGDKWGGIVMENARTNLGLVISSDDLTINGKYAEISNACVGITLNRNGDTYANSFSILQTDFINNDISVLGYSTIATTNTRSIKENHFVIRNYTEAGSCSVASKVGIQVNGDFWNMGVTGNTFRNYIDGGSAIFVPADNTIVSSLRVQGSSTDLTQRNQFINCTNAIVVNDNVSTTTFPSNPRFWFRFNDITNCLNGVVYDGSLGNGGMTISGNEIMDDVFNVNSIGLNVRSRGIVFIYENNIIQNKGQAIVTGNFNVSNTTIRENQFIDCGIGVHVGSIPGITTSKNYLRCNQFINNTLSTFTGILIDGNTTVPLQGEVIAGVGVQGAGNTFTGNYNWLINNGTTFTYFQYSGSLLPPVTRCSLLYKDYDCWNLPTSNRDNSNNGLGEMNSRNVNLYPNPTTEKINVEFLTTTIQQTTIVVRDLIGKELIIENITTTKGINVFEVDVSSVSPGSYMLEITLDGIKETKQLVKN